MKKEPKKPPAAKHKTAVETTKPNSDQPSVAVWGKAVDWLRRHGYKFYPLLLGLFPLLSFYGSNKSEIQSGDFNIITFFLFNLIIVGLVWLVAWLAIRSAAKASLLSAVLLLIFFSFGRVHDNIGSWSIKTPFTQLGPTKILLLISLAILVAVWFGLRRLSPKATGQLSLTLTVVGIYLFISTLISVGLAAGSGAKVAKQSDQPLSINTKKLDSAKLPDIYYILLDGYARADILKDKNTFNYDNSGFIKDLEKRGFYVAAKSNANYAHTHVSVPSTFNMKYLNYLTAIMGPDSTDRAPLQKLMRYNQVVPIFKNFGYKYVNIGSQWGWTADSPYSDIEIKSDRFADSKILGIKLDEFALVYLQTTAIKPWISSSIRGNLLAKVQGAFERTEKASQLPEPTFTFSHILAPHPPYLFNRQGPIAGLTDKLALDNPGFSNRKGYVDQLVYTNKLTLHMIDTILKNSDMPPIIILASDHGPASSLERKDFQVSDPKKLNVAGVRERQANLNAYYFPDRNYKKLYPSFTPVNSFRLVLDQYFGQNLKLLPDKAYFFDNKSHEYRFLDVTNLVD